MTFSEHSTSSCRPACKTLSEDEVWDKVRNEFVFNFQPILNASTNMHVTTARTSAMDCKMLCLSGILSPIVRSLKIVFQQACGAQTDWDKQLSEQHAKTFVRAAKRIEDVGLYARASRLVLLERKVGKKSFDSVMLVAFRDASKLDHDAVIY